jgi:YfiH family protein
MAAGLITVPAFASAIHGIRHFFGTRRYRSVPVAGAFHGGRRRLNRVISVKQIHGTDILIVDRSVPSETVFPGEWDGLMTNQAGLLLTIRTADCVPILFHDPIRCVIAAVHAGWRGAVAGIVPKALATMRRHFHSDYKDVRMVIGPSAGPCCYEVDEPVLRPLRERYSYWHVVIRETGSAKAMLDLKELARRQAQSLGLRSEHIWTVRICTICRPALFYSYRRDGQVKETMVSGILLTATSSSTRPTLPRRLPD